MAKINTEFSFSFFVLDHLTLDKSSPEPPHLRDTYNCSYFLVLGYFIYTVFDLGLFKESLVVYCSKLQCSKDHLLWVSGSHRRTAGAVILELANVMTFGWTGTSSV